MCYFKWNTALTGLVTGVRWYCIFIAPSHTFSRPVRPNMSIILSIQEHNDKRAWWIKYTRQYADFFFLCFFFYYYSKSMNNELINEHGYYSTVFFFSVKKKVCYCCNNNHQQTLWNRSNENKNWLHLINNGDRVWPGGPLYESKLFLPNQVIT